jgi:hypothetical protein
LAGAADWPGCAAATFAATGATADTTGADSGPRDSNAPIPAPTVLTMNGIRMLIRDLSLLVIDLGLRSRQSFEAGCQREMARSISDL